MNEEFLKNLIDEEQFIKIHANGNVVIRGKHLDKEQKNELRAESNSFGKSFIWQLLSQQVRNESFTLLYKATNEKELIAGQTMILNLEIMEKFIKKLTSL